MLDVLDSEVYQNGPNERRTEYLVIMKHAFKNAALPILTLAALNFVIY